MHTVYPAEASFRADLSRFVGVCHVVRGLHRARIGAVGARPTLVPTRVSQKICWIKYGMTAEDIVRAARELVEAKV
jgi:L-fucose isomerase-like protein